MKNIITSNVRDLSVFTVLSSTVFEDMFHQLILALAIVVINSIIIPLIKYLIKKIKTYNEDETIDKILNDFESMSIEELEKIIDKMKERKEKDE